LTAPARGSHESRGSGRKDGLRSGAEQKDKEEMGVIPK
jgi:hypothetical protein